MTHVVHTERLQLRPFETNDAAAIVSALNDPEMCQGLTVVPCPYTLADADWFIEHGTQNTLAVTVKDGTLVGAVGLGIQLGYWIAKAYWGKGYATEAARPLLTAHFAQSDEPVLSGYVDDNARSAAVLQKLGFEYAGDQMLHIRSRNRDVPGVSVKLTKDRWEAVS